jgi:hypothetical protein
LNGSAGQNAAQRPRLRAETGDTNSKRSITMRVRNTAAATVLLALLAGASGCVQVQSRQYIGVQAFSATKPDAVEVLRTPPTRPHLRLGEVTVEPPASASVKTIEQKFRGAAAKMGANAVVIVADRTEVMGVRETGSWYDADETPITGRVIVGVAIRYTDPPSQVGEGPENLRRPATIARAGPD